MKKYKYIGTEEQLIEHGFEVEHYSRRLIHAWKGCNDDELYLVLTWGNKQEDALDSTTRMIKWDTSAIKDDITPYIQDLIEAKLVEVQDV